MSRGLRGSLSILMGNSESLNAEGEGRFQGDLPVAFDAALCPAGKSSLG